MFKFDKPKSENAEDTGGSSGSGPSRSGRFLRKLMVLAGLTAATITGVEAQGPGRERGRISEQAPEPELPSSVDYGLPDSQGITELRGKFRDEFEKLENAYKKLETAKSNYDEKRGELFDLGFDETADVAKVDSAVKSLHAARQNLLRAQDAFHTKGRDAMNKSGRVTGDRGAIVDLYLTWQKVVNEHSAARPDYYNWPKVDQWYVSIIRKVKTAVAGTIRNGDALAESAMEYVTKQNRTASGDAEFTPPPEKDAGPAERRSSGPVSTESRDDNRRRVMKFRHGFDPNSSKEEAPARANSSAVRSARGAGPSSKTTLYKFGNLNQMTEDTLIGLEGNSLEEVLKQLPPREKERLLLTQKQLLQQKLEFQTKIEPKIIKLKQDVLKSQQEIKAATKDNTIRDLKKGSGAYRFGIGKKSITMTGFALMNLSGPGLDSALGDLAPTARIKLLEKQEELLKAKLKEIGATAKEAKVIEKKIDKTRKELDALREKVK